MLPTSLLLEMLPCRLTLFHQLCLASSVGLLHNQQQDLGNIVCTAAPALAAGNMQRCWRRLHTPDMDALPMRCRKV